MVQLLASWLIFGAEPGTAIVPHRLHDLHPADRSICSDGSAKPERWLPGQDSNLQHFG